MRLVLDACVLFPSVMRSTLLAVAGQGLYQPRWSDRILEEWARATPKLGPAAEAEARADIALMRARWPDACLPPAPHYENRLVLPDPNDTHVLAVAIAGSADAIVTLNAGDFPRGTLAEWKIDRRDPDSLLWELWSHHPDAVTAAARSVHAQAEAMAGTPLSIKALFKRARLPRFAKVLAE